MNELPEISVVLPTENNPGDPFLGIFNEASELNDIVMPELT